MQNEIIQSMHDQVRAIYRAFTGHEVADGETTSEPTYTVESITRRFAELESIARAFSSVMEQRPPVTFTPQVDIIAADTTVIVEVALPGVPRDAIVIERAGSTMVISGIRTSTASGRLFHTELPRGPFYRAIPLAFPIESDPRVELEFGVLRIYLTPAAVSPETTRGEGHDDEDGEQ